MPSRPNSDPAGPALRWLPGYVMAVFIVLASMSWWLTSRELERREQARFDRISVRLIRAVVERFRATEQALNGAQALILNTDFATDREQWATYVDSVRPYVGEGLVGLGFVEIVPRSELGTLERRMRLAGYEGFTAERSGDHDPAWIVTQAAPLPANARAPGEDIRAG